MNTAIEKLDIENVNIELEKANPETVLRWAAQLFSGKIIFSSSFSAEDMVILHIIQECKLPIEMITLDTGRLPEETYTLIDSIKKEYPAINIKAYFPDTRKVEHLLARKGFFSFRESIENRKECCAIRKIEPLQRALQTAEAWITGVRKGQSVSREKARIVEYDSLFDCMKINPLLNWSEEEVWIYIKEKNIPYNSLYDLGYSSIGCAPCTRAIKPGEDIRAGRWWWENAEGKECGIHGYCHRK